MARARMPGISTPPPRLAKDPEVDRSLRHSLRDGVYFSAMIGSAESYFSAFAVLLKASTAQIGMLAALPPLLASFTQLSSAWVGRALGARLPRRSVRRDIIVFGALLQALTLIPLAVLPMVFPDLALPLLITCAVIYFMGPNLGSPQWGSLMGDLVPETRRGRFFALRTRLSSLANFSALIIAGFVLHALDQLEQTYFGFLVLFVSAALLRLASAWHLSRMHDPPGHLAALEAPWHRELWLAFRGTGLLRFSVFFACMQFAVAIASPFFTLYMLRDLQFSYVAFMFNTAASVCVQFLTLSRWGRLSDLFGNRLILVTTGLIIPLLPSLWLVSTSYVYLLAVQALSGLIWAGFTLSATNSAYDLTPRSHRATLMAVHSVLAATGVFLGALLGGWLGTVLPREITLLGTGWSWLTPLYGVFAISTVARLTVALAFLPRLKEVRKVRRMTRSGLIFRVTRLHPVSGLVFEIVGRFRRNDDTRD
jgi:MFS family permease